MGKHKKVRDPSALYVNRKPFRQHLLRPPARHRDGLRTEKCTGYPVTSHAPRQKSGKRGRAQRRL